MDSSVGGHHGAPEPRPEPRVLAVRVHPREQVHHLNHAGDVLGHGVLASDAATGESAVGVAGDAVVGEHGEGRVACGRVDHLCCWLRYGL